jgi:hypothetical protein
MALLHAAVHYPREYRGNGSVQKDGGGKEFLQHRANPSGSFFEEIDIAQLTGFRRSMWLSGQP